VSRFGRGLAALLVVACAGAALTGCAATDERTRTDDVCARIEAHLAKEPGVLGAKVDFLYSPVNPGDASARVEVGDGTDPAAMAATVTRLIWTSELDPLRRISVTVHTGSGQQAVVAYTLPAQNGELRRLYGERPELAHAQQIGSALLIGLAAIGLLGFLLLVALAILVIVLVRRRRALAARG
jgi:hypothetical protein